MPRSEGRSTAAVGSAVVMWKLTCPCVLVAGGEVQVDSVMVDGSVQVKVTVPLKGLKKANVIVASMLDPCATWKLVAVGVRVNSAGAVAAHAIASLSASTEPSPVTRL